MRRMATKNKILRTVIKAITVNVMNYFPLFKKSANRFFHHKVVFTNVSLMIRIWVTGLINRNIFSPFIFSDGYSPKPMSTFFTDPTFSIARLGTKLLEVCIVFNSIRFATVQAISNYRRILFARFSF